MATVLGGLKTRLTRHIDLHFGAACDMRHAEFNQVFPFASKLKTYVPRHFAHVLRQVKTNAAIKQTYFMHGDRTRQLARERQKQRQILSGQTRKEKLLKNVAHVQPIVSGQKKRQSKTVVQTDTHTHTLTIIHTHTHMGGKESQQLCRQRC